MSAPFELVVALTVKFPPGKVGVGAAPNVMVGDIRTALIVNRPVLLALSLGLTVRTAFTVKLNGPAAVALLVLIVRVEFCEPVPVPQVRNAGENIQQGPGELAVVHCANPANPVTVRLARRILLVALVTVTR